MKYQSAFLAVLTCGVVLLATAPVLAEDIYPPEWRGEPNSTLQIWEFSTDVNPAAPDVDQNPFGTAEVTVHGEFNFPLRDTWWIPEDFGHTGVWNVGGTMAIEIPNDPELRPLKKIRLQMTYDGGPSTEPDPWIEVIASDGAAVTDFQLVAKTALDDIYSHAVYDLELAPNPSMETIYIQPRFCQVYIDEIVVDTICVPEPSTVLLLVIGAAGLAVCALRRRGR